jgi:hypothetical protein
MASTKASPGGAVARLTTLQVILIVCVGLVAQTLLTGRFLMGYAILDPVDSGATPSSQADSFDSYPGGNPLAIPPGRAVNLPSVRGIDENIDRKIYGGKGDG